MPGKLFVLIFLLVIITSAWVYRDARQNKIGKILDKAMKNNRSAGGWAAQGIALYLRNRKELLSRATQFPVQTTGYAGWTVFGLLAIIWWFSASSVFEDGLAEAIVAKSAIPISTNDSKDVALFKRFKYGQLIDEFPVGEQYEDCSAEIGQAARCADGIDFMGDQYALALVFSEGALASVSLVTDFSEEAYRKLMASLPKNGFNLALMQGRTGRLDLIETVKKEGRSAFMAKITEFESINLYGGQLTYMFVEMSGEDLKGYKNVVDAVSKMPPQNRELDLTVAEDEGAARIILKFTLPRLDLQKFSNSGVASEESF